jgi:hypothetical protein
MTRTVTRSQRGISLSRLMLAIFTLGLSVPFVGVRRVRRETVYTH